VPVNLAVNFLWVAVGGAVGASVRYAVSLYFMRLDSQFPFATFIVNFSGAFAAGFLVHWLALRNVTGSSLQLFFVVGFLGSFTTLSAFSVETLRLLHAGHLPLAGLNVAATIVCCILAVYLGSIAAHSLSH
jgi:CrcB protein